MIVVLADDITGAAEIAGVALNYGIQSDFLLSEDGSLPHQTSNSGKELVVISTNSRSLTEQQALTIYQRLIGEVHSYYSGQIQFFKKCDSVLRGYVLTELVPLIRLSGKVVLQPANPTAQRVISKGLYLVEGEPINKTPFCNDPDFPAVTADVGQLLQTRNPLFFTSSDYTLKLNTGIKEHSPNGVYLTDCNSEEDMMRLLTSLPSGSDNIIFAGSSAFFGQYLQCIHTKKQALKSGGEVSTIKQPFLVLAGSAHNCTVELRRQFEKAGMSVICFNNELRKENFNIKELDKLTAQLTEAYRRTINQPPATIPDNSGLPPCFQSGRGILLMIGGDKVEFNGAASVLNQRLCSAASDFIRSCEIKEVYCSGGATAWELLHQMQWKQLIPERSIAPGVLRMAVDVKAGNYLTIKPGSYPWM